MDNIGKMIGKWTRAELEKHLRAEGARRYSRQREADKVLRLRGLKPASAPFSITSFVSGGLEVYDMIVKGEGDGRT